MVTQLVETAKLERAATAGGGTSSEISKKGTGPKPMENEATKAIIEMALII